MPRNCGLITHRLCNACLHRFVPEHRTIFGTLRTVTTDGVAVGFNTKQTATLTKVRAKKSLVKRRQRADLTGSNSFRKETRNYRAKAGQKVNELRTATQAGIVDASREFTVFLPKNHQCRQVPLHMKRADFWTADIFVVDDINCVTAAGSLDATAMWSMVLGKRLATPSYLSSPKKDRLTSTCSIKYKQAYTVKELAWWLTPEFIRKEGHFYNTLARTCTQPNSKWMMLDQMTLDRWKKTKALSAKVYHVDCMRDFHTHIRKLATVDKFSTSCGVLKK